MPFLFTIVLGYSAGAEYCLSYSSSGLQNKYKNYDVNWNKRPWSYIWLKLEFVQHIHKSHYKQNYDKISILMRTINKFNLLPVIKFYLSP